MRSPEPSSEDSFSQAASKVNRKVRFSPHDKFKMNLKQIKKQHRESKFIKQQQLPVLPRENSEDLKQSFYFRVKVISKVGVFIEKLKGLVAITFPNFKYNEMDYIETQISDDNSHKFLFSAENKLIIFLQMILLLTSIISIWNVSFLLLFPEEYLLPMQLRFYMLVLFTVEIIVNLFVMPPSTFKEEFKMDHKSVMIHYFKNNFFYDFISLLSLTILEIVHRSYPLLYLFKLLAILKLGTVFRVIKKLEVTFVSTPESESYIGIIKLILKILSFVHLLSLTLNMIHQVEIQQGILETWLHRYGMAGSSAFSMYLCGWYWGATILTTVGFGDIVPANPYEAFAISLIQIICCAIFGYSINYIGGLIGVLGESTELFQKQMRRVNQYLQNVDVTKSLKNEIRQHFYNKEKIKKIHDPIAESIVMDNIPVPMKNMVLSTNNKNVLQKTNFFKRYSDDILTKLAMTLKRTIYSPQEAIFNKGDSKSILWILEKGSINEYYNNEPNNIEKIIAEYTPLTVQPGYINFITGEPFTTYSRSLGFSWTYQVSREDMITVLRAFKTEYHKFCQMKDNLIQKGKKFVSRCCACLKLSHNALECPRIHFQARIKLFKLASISRQQANQRHFYPRSAQKYKTLSLFSEMIDEDSLNLNSIYIQNQRRNSMSDLPPIYDCKHSSKRVSTVMIEMQPRIPHRHSSSEDKPMITESEVPRLENVEQLRDFKFSLWFDQCKFADPESYFPESHVSNLLAIYNKSREEKVETMLNLK